MQFLSNTHGCDGWAGEMAQRIRAFDWSTTDLGLMGDWPSSLTSAVQMMLASPMPMVLRVAAEVQARAAAEEQLRQSQKREAMTRLPFSRHTAAGRRPSC